MKPQKVDNGKKFVSTGRDGQVNTFFINDFQYAVIGKIILYRLLNDRDIKIVITGKGKSTGTGKTTLAIILARWVNMVRNEIFETNHEWSAEEYSFMDVWDYLRQYSTANPGDPLITDELEWMADRRRSMSNDNVYFSEAWQVLRYKNVVTIGTCPHLSDVDKRIPESSDIWINVTETGKGNVYYLQMNDFDWNMEFKRLKLYGFKETIHWNDIGQTEDYQWLKQHKQDMGVPGLQKKDEVTEKDLDSLEKEIRTNAAIDLLELVEEKDLKRTITQADIGEAVGYSQQNIAKIKREHL